MGLINNFNTDCTAPKGKWDHIKLGDEQTKMLKGSQKRKRESGSRTLQTGWSITPNKRDVLAAGHVGMWAVIPSSWASSWAFTDFSTVTTVWASPSVWDKEQLPLKIHWVFFCLLEVYSGQSGSFFGWLWVGYTRASFHRNIRVHLFF